MTKILTIQNSDGIHARPASLFSTTANHYVSEIQIGRIGEKKNKCKIHHTSIVAWPQAGRES